MTIKDGRLIECTEMELYEWYLSHNWDDLYSFILYEDLFIMNGGKITDV